LTARSNRRSRRYHAGAAHDHGDNQHQDLRHHHDGGGASDGGGTQGSDTVTESDEAYADPATGTGKILNVNPGFTVNDGMAAKTTRSRTAADHTGAIDSPGDTDTRTIVSTSNATPVYGAS